MHELGNVQNAINPWSVFNPWATQETQASSESSNESHVYDDAAAAAINPWTVYNPWDTQETQPSLEIYNFTPKQIEAEANMALQCQGNLEPGRVLNLLRDTIGELNAAD